MTVRIHWNRQKILNLEGRLDFEWVKRGFSRVRVDGMIHQLTDRLSLDKKLKHDIELVVDRLVVKEGIRSRLTDSIETALREGKGTLVVADADKEQKVGPGIDPEAYKAHDRFFSELNACPTCNLSFQELAPQVFSFNSPLGSCPDCQGLGTRAEMDPDLIIPDPSLTIREGAVEPWASGMERGEGWTFEFVEHLSRSLGIDPTPPGRSCPAAKERVVSELSSLLVADMELHGPGRVAWIEKNYLMDKRRSTPEVQAALLALSVQAGADGAISRGRIVESYRTFIRSGHPLAGYVAPDLTGWKDWSAVPDYVALLKSGSLQHPASIYAALMYLESSPSPEARATAAAFRARAASK